MDTPPDGTSPTMAMFLFYNNNNFRDINGGDDAAIVYHEYTHGLSSRLITVNPTGGEQALNSAQAGAMGEAWSDFYAKDFIVDQFPSEDTGAPGEVDMGDYTDSVPHTIRSQALDCPVSSDPSVTSVCPGDGLAGAGGYTYADLGRIAGGNEVHADGEIWAETLWDLRAAVGSDVAEAIVTQGMRLTPPEPKFLDARSAIVAADAQLYPYGDHSDQLWSVFARRGMGTNALSPTAGTAVDGFKVPPAAKLSAGTAVAGQPVTLDAAGSVDRDGSVASYDFDLDGDGTYEVTATATPQQTFTYANPGTVHPAVRVRDNEGQVDTAAIELTVAAPPKPVASPTPTPTATVTPTPTPSAAPRVKFSKAGRKGRATVTVTCDSTCKGTVGITVQPSTARKLGLGKRRTVARASFRLTKAGTKKVTVRLSAKARKGLTRKRIERVTTRVTVKVTDAEGQSAKPSRTVRIRRR